MAERLTKSFTIDEWKTLRKELKDKSLLTDKWKDAIKLLDERIFERYLDPLELLVTNSSNKGEGFTILTVECTLIEFLATLEEGRLFKRDKISTDSHWYYKKSAKIYERFLRTAPLFETAFSSQTNEKPLFLAHDFYMNVRCALIHEAQTKNNWEVKIYKDKSQDELNEICFDTENGKKLIYRTALFKGLKIYFKDFIHNKLTLETNRGRILRKHLARKIDHIAEISPDQKFWWT